MRYMKLTDTAIAPTRGTPGSAGLDLYADMDAMVSSWASVMVGTGIAVEIPEGYVGFVFIRSSMGKAGVALANAVGVIDSDYRGEIKLQLIYNNGNGGHSIRQGERIAQLVVMPAQGFELTEADALSTTERGTGGFGSTGT
jgi:dUTP pyrophosphatase